jgi:galactokinase
VVSTAPTLDQLRAAGFAPARAAALRSTLATLDAALVDLGAAAPTLTLLVPGRIEVFGKHTDYAGGASLLCAVERGIALRAAPRDDRLLRIIDRARGSELRLPLAADTTAPAGSWGNYVATVVRRLCANFPECAQGADVALASDLPSASGLSSSSALVVAIARVLIARNGLDRTLAWQAAIGSIEDEAAYLGTVENGADFGPLRGSTGVGTFGGSEDHAAILGARPGALLHMGFAPLRRLGVLPLPSDHVFVIGVSGVVADKTGRARERYNAVAGRARALVALWNTAMADDAATLATVLARGADAAERLRALVRDTATLPFPAAELLDRLAHFEAEAGRHLPAAVDALRRGDLAAFGAAADTSQQDAERWLHNQVPETILLQRLAREHGAVAASAFGAGFGGAVWALVPRPIATPFAARWLDAYRRDSLGRRQRRAVTFLTEAAPALQRW